MMVLKWFASFLKSLKNFSIRDFFFSKCYLYRRPFLSLGLVFRLAFQLSRMAPLMMLARFADYFNVDDGEWLFSSRVAFLDDFSLRCCVQINVEKTFDFRINCVGRIVSGCPNDPDARQDVLSCCCQIVIRVVTRISTTTVSFSARR